jgi:hypothetical protein
MTNLGKNRLTNYVGVRLKVGGKRKSNKNQMVVEKINGSSEVKRADGSLRTAI